MYSGKRSERRSGSGALAPEAAAKFRSYVAGSRHAPAVDEESFRLLTGFNDIFVAIAAVAVLVGVAWLGSRVWLPAGGIAAAIVSRGLAEYFTRRRRMALPSILLMLSFVGGIAAACVQFVIQNSDWLEDFSNRVSPGHPEPVMGVVGAIIAAITAGAAWVHWKRFTVPITVAAGAVACVGVVIALVTGFVPGARDAIFPLVLVAGLGMFALAMAWDMSDLERKTRRSDVAFWLHLAAAPMIAHSIFHMLGVFSGSMTPAMAGVVLALYVGFALVALAVDRRALLVSSLAYVLYALYALFHQAGAVELSAALTALVIGSALLTLSAFWQTMRRGVVSLVGGLRDRLPPVQLPMTA